jgi:amidohydrolase
MDKESLKRKVCACIDQSREQIVGVGEAIMDEPELGFKEDKTAARVGAFFGELGLEYRDGLALTGIKAVLPGSKPGPTVALMGELDALVLPDHPRADKSTGAAHACGHNAQIAGLMGAALGLSAAEAGNELAGNVVFFAIPAEEYVEIDYRFQLVQQGKMTFLGGKPELIELGCFDDIDMAMMIHTSSSDLAEGSAGVASSSNGFVAKNIRFVGKAAHAGVAPEKGVNALQAANLALVAINSLRDTFKDADTVRVHPIITKGGDLVNIVPAEVTMETYVRARTPDAVLDAASKVDRALKGAAVALGCIVEIQTVPGYMPLVNDKNLSLLFKDNSEQLMGKGEFREYPHGSGSTDAGDLSQIMPVLHPYMAGASGNAHSTEWHIANPDNGYVAPAKALAMMAIDLLHGDAEGAERVRKEFTPSMTKADYLDCQKKLFQRVVFDGSQI